MKSTKIAQYRYMAIRTELQKALKHSIKVLEIDAETPDEKQQASREYQALLAACNTYRIGPNFPS